MFFKDRRDAGRQLARRLSQYAGDVDVIVLGIPHGGVPVAFEVAQALRAPLDVFLSGKLGVPGNEELAFGALADRGGRVLDESIIRALGITPEQIQQITESEERKLIEQAQLYRKARPALNPEGKTVILIDDGIATGSSIYAAMQALRQMHPRMLVIAVPVAPPSTCSWLRTKVDDLVVLHAPVQFQAVGEFYRDFSQTSDQEVIELLKRSTHVQNPQ
ncbi:MAG: phosphoribosyltransferase [Silvibacterium sp.]|nr:phosphoribosyltransferase [Silvibacterium sp.]MBV8438453.1 phosphoribosyltransferase [Silvibacterium sp.]